MRVPPWMGAAILGLLLLFASLAGCIGADEGDEETQYTVTTVIDGDTVKLDSGQQVRLLGINAPEAGEHWAANATGYLTSLVLNQKVTLKADVEDKDRYDRLLRHIFLVANKTHVNLAMVEAGWAHTLFNEASYLYQVSIEAAEARAKAAELGIWVQSSYKDGIEFTDLTEATEQESFTFKNKSNASVNLSGWTVKDAIYNIYTFYNLTLPADATLTLYTGQGTNDTLDNTSYEVYWGRDLDIEKDENNKFNYVWNNGGDRLFLRDGEGLLVLDYRYGDMAWPPE